MLTLALSGPYLEHLIGAVVFLALLLLIGALALARFLHHRRDERRPADPAD